MSRAAFATRLAGGGDLRLLCLGDSTTRGVNRTLPPADQTANSYPARLAPLLAAGLGRKVAADGFLGLGNLPDGDARIATDFTAERGGIGRTHYRAIGPARLRFTPEGAWDVAEVHVIPLAGAAFVCRTDGAEQLFAPAAADRPMTLDFQAPGGTAPLEIAWHAGEVALVGVSCRLAGEPEITILNGASGGGVAGHFTGRNPTRGALAWIRHLAPALTVLDFGINEFLRGTPPAEYRGHLDTLIDAAGASGTVLLKTFIPNGKPGGGFAQSAYVEVVRDLAARRGLPLLDLHARWGSHAKGRAKGWYVDRSHGSVAGYLAVADAVAEAVAALSRS